MGRVPGGPPACVLPPPAVLLPIPPGAPPELGRAEGPPAPDEPPDGAPPLRGAPSGSVRGGDPGPKGPLVGVGLPPPGSPLPEPGCDPGRDPPGSPLPGPGGPDGWDGEPERAPDNPPPGGDEDPPGSPPERLPPGRPLPGPVPPLGRCDVLPRAAPRGDLASSSSSPPPNGSRERMPPSTPPPGLPDDDEPPPLEGDPVREPLPPPGPDGRSSSRFPPGKRERMPPSRPPPSSPPLLEEPIPPGSRRPPRRSGSSVRFAIFTNPPYPGNSGLPNRICADASVSTSGDRSVCSVAGPPEGARPPFLYADGHYYAVEMHLSTNQSQTPHAEPPQPLRPGHTIYRTITEHLFQ